MHALTSRREKRSLQQKKTAKQLQWNKNAHHEKTSREHRTMGPDGTIVSDIVTVESVEETSTGFEEEVSEIIRTSIAPIVHGQKSILQVDSLFLTMLHNRFDMLEAQASMLEYVKHSSTDMGPGIYLRLPTSSDLHRPIKVNYPVFRGLVPFFYDYKMRQSFTPFRIPVLWAGSALHEKKDDQVNRGNHLKLDRITCEEWKCFEQHHQSLFGLWDMAWKWTYLTPLTIEDLVMTTLCRYVARLRNYAMPEVDKEEYNTPYPLTHVEIIPRRTTCWGQAQQIISHDSLSRLPINGISNPVFANLGDPIEDSVQTKTQTNESDFQVIIYYKLPHFNENSFFTPAMHKMSTQRLLEFTRIKSLQRMGYNVTEDVNAFIGGNTKLTQVQAKLFLTFFPNYLYTRISSQGSVECSFPLDMESIVALKRYIAWCHEKFQRTTSPEVSFLSYHQAGLGFSTQDFLKQVEHSLRQSKKEKWVLALQNQTTYVPSLTTPTITTALPE